MGFRTQYLDKIIITFTIMRIVNETSLCFSCRQAKRSMSRRASPLPVKKPVPPSPCLSTVDVGSVRHANTLHHTSFTFLNVNTTNVPFSSVRSTCDSEISVWWWCQCWSICRLQYIAQPKRWGLVDYPVLPLEVQVIYWYSRFRVTYTVVFTGPVCRADCGRKQIQ